ncbi:hypothetical protein KP509_39G008300 [Ceratopteris richardii]|uniref:Sec-independent protein translocase protein TATB, chloroplastic n=1 Tax=Ceratopteris richardii TaxID=49495 RepID=A0A8T2PY67_CERRI|nr:hypothetical protein KP509_39G008300 [Ceratopteris richardii]
MAGSSVVLPASQAITGTACLRREAVASLSMTSLRVGGHQLRLALLPKSSFFAWEARTHLGSSSLKTFLSLQGCLFTPGHVSRRVVYASLFGVGAPEALVIAVVALLVFGPRGLAEVARTIGKSLRAFQPTIRELQQISRDFKDTLEQEIGLDELRMMDTRPSQPVYKPDKPPQASADGQIAGESVEPRAYSTEDYVRVTEEQAKVLVPEDQRKEAAAWGGSPPSAKVQAEESVQQVDEVANNVSNSQ